MTTTRSSSLPLLALTAIATALTPAAAARAWDPFLVENSQVAAGNEQFAASEATAALHHYDLAARELPREPGVHLNRGLALLESGELERAREALALATEPPATPQIRADAHYDLGLAWYREGDAAAQADDHETSQRHFREAADAFRRSLRLRPGNADAGWNLELALRRLREEEEAQEQQEQENEDQENEDEEGEDQEGEDQENQDQEGEDQENQDQENQDQEGDESESQDPENQDSENQDSENQDQEGEEQENQDQEGEDGSDESDEGEDGSEDTQEPESQEQDGSESGEDQEQPAPGEEGTDERSLPPESRRVLDALQDQEQNLQRHRAASRARREGRRVEQDW